MIPKLPEILPRRKKNVTFRFQSGPRAHVKLSHSGQFKCPQCTYLYEDKAKFREHIDFSHPPTEDSISGEEPGDESETENPLSEDEVYECELCTPVFFSIKKEIK